MRPNIDLVVFDMAGTTVRDDGDIVARALAGALGDVLGLCVELSSVREVMGLPKPDSIRALIARSNRAELLERDVERAHCSFVGSMVRYYSQAAGVAELPGARQTFQRLRRSGVRVALDTGFSRPIVDAILQRLGWRSELDIDATVASCEVERGRPHADSILRAMSMTGVRDPRRVAKVGDTAADMLAGTTAGCAMVVGVGSGSATLVELARSPHTHLVGDVRHMPGLLVAEQAPHEDFAVSAHRPQRTVSHLARVAVRP